MIECVLSESVGDIKLRNINIKVGVNMEELTKVCTKCGEEKLLSEFYKDKHGKLGVRGDCKRCSSRKKTYTYDIDIFF